MLQSDSDHEANRERIWKQVKENNIQFIRLQFTDIFGFAKNVAITPDELDKAMDGELMFDGSSVDGFARIEESDMYLKPDLETFSTMTWRPDEQGVGYMFCDVYNAEGQPFEGCPRNILKRTIAEAREMGYSLNVGPEGEFFLFYTDDKGRPVFDIHDDAGYFDLSPVDRGEDARRDIILTMRKLGFSIEASHHEVAPGQHEVDFKYDEALRMADKWITFKQIVKNIANVHGLYASFLPKPFAGQNGNAMHCNQSLVKQGDNVFSDPDHELGLSQTALYYVGGLLKHARGIAAVCNPTVNSYKRLLPGYEAPTNITWSASNRSALIRVPIANGQSTRIELRNPDPTANPYLVYAVMLRAGLEGIKNKIEPPPAVDKNIFDLSEAERRDYQIGRFPRSLLEALDEMEKDELVRKTLGSHGFESFIKAKRKEWEEYEEQVHEWEIKKYLSQY